MDLDEKNKIIFEHLLVNARAQISDLARILKITKPAVMKRIRFLEEQEYIIRYDAIINWQKLPFIKKTYFVKVENDPQFEKQMIQQQSVFSLISLSGLYNYQVWCFFKNKKQQLLFEKIMNQYEQESIEISTLLFPRVTFFKLHMQLPPPKIQDKEMKISSIDIAIMKHMAQGHGRQSLYEMSKILKIPYDSVHYHGKNLIKAGYFLAIVAQPGTNKFTLQTTTLLIECSNKQIVQQLHEKVKSLAFIRSDAVGGTKVMVHFLSQTHLEYRTTLAEIFSLMPRTSIKKTLIAHWDKVILNNRYPLEYFLKTKVFV
ncbi:MAG TPA: Lrp/AsnC family transcriptional regulator [Candidatus Nanoarchaeia archaeon]|nr:Lrp/AsnC family transcriptional regulator [Candidatus Nanoarchaeia archaeon]